MPSEAFIPRTERERFMSRLGAFYDSADAERWMAAPNLQLGGEVPNQVAAAGQWNRLWQILDRLESGAYL